MGILHTAIPFSLRSSSALRALVFMVWNATSLAAVRIGADLEKRSSSPVSLSIVLMSIG